jgi:hypothetical protein
MNDARLVALVDNVPLDPEAGRALWTEFSAHMDAHEGDMAGFAKAKGWVSVAPEYRQGKAVLVVKTGAPITARAPRATPHPTPAAKPKPKARAKNPTAKPAPTTKKPTPRG